MYKLFDAHSDLFEDVDEKRQRGLRDIIRNYHKGKWTAGGYAGGFCPIWVDPFCEVYDLPVAEQFSRIVAHMQEELNDCSDIVVPVTCLAEFEAAAIEEKTPVFLGTEGLSFLHGDWGPLDDLYTLGFREFSLTWNETNEFAEGATGVPAAGLQAGLSSAGSPVSGLTSAGRECVKKIRSLGAILDLAHAGKQTFYDAASIIDGPFMVSHANASHVCDHPRNLTDHQLHIIAEYGGVLGVTACPPFLSSDPIHRNVASLCDHIEYIADIMGIEHVGLGLDLVDFLDDFGTDPTISEVTAGLESITRAQNIAAELARRGFTPGEIAAIFSGNFLRFIEKVLG